ncbi:MAG: MlaD family protein [Gemmatimonadales bacterium]|jgi:phospholipid/cholesterol/gamma-HCH transport system substrate-binding protein
MDLYYKQEVSVGLLVIVAVAGFFAGLMWLTGRSFRASQIKVPVQFTEVGNLNAGDPVQISGVTVGRVAERDLLEEGRVVITLEVDRRFPPMIDAKVSIKSLDFLGAKLIAYSPGSSSTPLGEGQVIIGSSGSDIAGAVDDLTGDAAEVLIGMQRILSEQMAEDVHNTLQATERALTVLARAGEGPLVGQAEASFKALEQVALRLDTTLANPGINESLSQLDELTENVTEMTQGLASATMSLSAMLEQVSDTGGSLGKLLRQPMIHDDLHALLVSLTKLLDDVRERPGRYTNVSVF